MDEQHNKLMAYVLDEPEAAAREIAKLREFLGAYLAIEEERGGIRTCYELALEAASLRK